MLSSASLDRSLQLLIEVVTHKQIARKQAPFARSIEREAARFFRKQGIAVGRAYAVTQLQEAAIDDVLAGVDIGALAQAITRAYVGGMIFAGAEYALGIKFTLKNPRAVAYQKDRGVELLKELNKTTKNDINELIIAGLEAGTSPEKIARSIRSLFVSYAATKRGKRSRAQLVAITETARAYSAGNHGAILDASGTGLAFEKSWLTANDDRVDPHCSANQSQGWIAMGADHSSGVQYPPDHPGCRCVERYRRIDPPKVIKPTIIGTPSKEIEQAIINAYSPLAHKYPFLQDKKQMAGIDTTSNLSGNEFDNFTRTVRINKYYSQGTLAAMNAFQDDESKANGALVGGLDYTLVHELGHAVDTYIKRNLPDEDLYAEFQQAKRDLRKALGDPSKYGSKNDNEWFAERFLAEERGIVGDRALQKLIDKYIAMIT